MSKNYAIERPEKNRLKIIPTKDFIKEMKSLNDACGCDFETWKKKNNLAQNIMPYFYVRYMYSIDCYKDNEDVDVLDEQECTIEIYAELSNCKYNLKEFQIEGDLTYQYSLLSNSVLVYSEQEIINYVLNNEINGNIHWNKVLNSIGQCPDNKYFKEDNEIEEDFDFFIENMLFEENTELLDSMYEDEEYKTGKIIFKGSKGKETLKNCNVLALEYGYYINGTVADGLTGDDYENYELFASHNPEFDIISEPLIKIENIQVDKDVSKETFIDELLSSIDKIAKQTNQQFLNCIIRFDNMDLAKIVEEEVRKIVFGTNSLNDKMYGIEEFEFPPMLVFDNFLIDAKHNAYCVLLRFTQK